MGLPELLTKMRIDILPGNVGESSCFKLIPARQAHSFEEVDTLSVKCSLLA